MPKYFEGDQSAEGLKIGVVASRFNELITQGLLEGTLRVLAERGGDPEQIDVAWVPGAFEIPLVAKKMALSRQYDAVICLGAVIRGETPHFDYIASEVSKGIARTALETGVPIILGVLTTDNLQQALDRCGRGQQAEKEGMPDEMHRGQQAALAAVEMANLMRKIK
jgi:6,7-dimethyl-8-ribityllumazine synthase